VTRTWRRAILYAVLTGAGVLLLLAGLGRLLVVDDSLEPADAIVVLAARESRARGAAALYQRGLAPRIVLARVPSRRDTQARVLRAAGVPATAIAQLGRVTENTRDELQAEFDYAQAQGFRRVILVTSPYHTRRVALIWQQTARGRMAASVHATPYERFEPYLWWTSTTHLRYGLHELGGIVQVLLLALRG
jgi:uncharacterized SAM-binding protein YcdF (DUF218 family)